MNQRTLADCEAECESAIAESSVSRLSDLSAWIRRRCWRFQVKPQAFAIAKKCDEAARNLTKDAEGCSFYRPQPRFHSFVSGGMVVREVA